MKIEFDPDKRGLILADRGIDLACSGEVFEVDTISVVDDRRDYGETRYITIGRLDERMVILVWTERGDACRIISVRKANVREQKAYGDRV